MALGDFLPLSYVCVTYPSKKLNENEKVQSCLRFVRCTITNQDAILMVSG